MEYATLTAAYEQVEATPKRLEMASHLAALFKATPGDHLARVVYLTQGRLAPDHKGVELGLADRLVVKAVAFAAGVPEKDLEDRARQAGDLGTVAEEILAKRRQTALFSQPLTVERVHATLEKIAAARGSGAQDVKQKLLADLLHDGAPRDARYLVRTVLGRLRLGTGDMTILDGLAGAFLTKEDRPRLERAYNLTADLGTIAEAVAAGGLVALDRFTVTLGAPVRPMLAERMPTMEESLAKLGGDALLEFKYDGLRIQAHLDGKKVTLFSRRQEEITAQFPDVVAALQGSCKAKGAIVEGECVPVDLQTGEILPFQEVAHRRGRKLAVTSAVDDYPVTLILFDALRIGDQVLIDLPLVERRAALEKAFRRSDRIQFSETLRTTDPAAAQAFFQRSIAAGCEGVMAKQPSSVYTAGNRGFQWIKFKREYRSEMTDSADLVIVGAFAGRGRRSGRYGALLMATFNKDEGSWETVCKLGTGFNDEFLAALPARIDGERVAKRDRRVTAEMKPDVHFTPRHVLEVIGAEITVSPVHTCARGRGRLPQGAGLAVRFPRYTGKWREDKRAEDATTTAEILGMYEGQSRRRAGAAAATAPPAAAAGGEEE